MKHVGLDMTDAVYADLQARADLYTRGSVSEYLRIGAAYLRVIMPLPHERELDQAEIDELRRLVEGE